MPHRCAFGCEDLDAVMHVFPNPKKFSERFKVWVNLVGGELQTLPDEEIYKKKRICDIHFTGNQRCRFKRLNALAVPCLHLPGTTRAHKSIDAIETEPVVNQAIVPAQDVSESTVRRVEGQGDEKYGNNFTSKNIAARPGRPSNMLSNFDICAIRQKVHYFYTVRKEVPTIGKLLIQLRKDSSYDGSRDHLRKHLKKIGFQYKKCKTNKQIVIEKTIVAHKREVYLKLIKENRNLPKNLQKDIIYLDENYIYSNYEMKKCWQSIFTENEMLDKSKEKRWLIITAGNEKGFVPNALMISGDQQDHPEINKRVFTRWVTGRLMPNLTKPSIIVMDDAPYHTVHKNEVPTSANTIDEIKSWLLFNNVTFEPDLRKPSLVMLVKKHMPAPVNEIDEILGQEGHTVLRLPSYHYDLNPIELIWDLAENKLATQNDDLIGTKILEAFESISSEDWENCCERVKEIEKEYYYRGRTLYSDIDELVNQFDRDSTDEDSESSDESIIEMDPINIDSSSSDSRIDTEKIPDVEYLDLDMFCDD